MTTELPAKPSVQPPGISIKGCRQLRGLCAVVLHTPERAEKLAGTGFFITQFGHFLTAGHVMLSGHELVSETGGPFGTRQYVPRFGMHVVQFHPLWPHSFAVTVRDVLGFTLLERVDLAIGYTRPQGGAVETPFARLSSELPKLGDAVTLTHLAESRPEDRGFALAESAGEVTELCEPGRGQTWQCHHFRASVDAPSGASGSPVFGASLEVLGCLSSSEIGQTARVMPVREIFETQIPLLFGVKDTPTDTLRGYHARGHARIG